MNISKLKRLLLLTLLASCIGNFAYAGESIIEQENDLKSESSINFEADGKTILIQDLKGTVEQQEIKKNETPLKAWINGDYATGDRKGIRTKLEEKGVTLGAEYINNNFLKMRGGLNNKHPLKYQGLINTSIEINTEKLGLWKGGRAYTSFANLHGSGLTNNYVGDLQVLSNIDAPSYAQLYEYWYEQSLLGDKVKVKIGRQDANADFCVLENAGEYINSSFGIAPNVPIPMYPAPGLGVSTIISPNKLVDIKYGFFDGGAQIGSNAFKTPFDGNDGAVHITELSFKPEIKGHLGNYIAGYWLHTGDTDEITNSVNPKT